MLRVRVGWSKPEPEVTTEEVARGAARAVDPTGGMSVRGRLRVRRIDRRPLWRRLVDWVRRGR